MKKKPSMIFSILINILNNLDLEKEYSINEISDISGLHWKTTKDYLDILIHLLKFTPQIKYNEITKKIQILNQSQYFEELSTDQKILLSLYQNKAVNKESSLKVENYIPNFFPSIEMEKLKRNKKIEIDENTNGYYLTRSGKISVIAIYSDITNKIFDLEESEDNLDHLKLDDFQKLDYVINQNKEIKDSMNILSNNNIELNLKVNNFLEFFKVGHDTTELSSDMERIKIGKDYPKIMNFFNINYLKVLKSINILSSNDQLSSANWAQILPPKEKRWKLYEKELETSE